MNAHCKRGYLFDRNIRCLPIISWISGMGITAFSIFLWYLVVYDDSLLVIPSATVFTAFNIFFIFRAIKSRDFTESTYTCRDHSAAVHSGKESWSFDLKEPFWLTKCSIRLYIGKGGYEDITVIAITPVRLDQILCDFTGEKAFTKVFQSGGILLPMEAEEWILRATGAKSVSTFPKSMYFQSGPSSRQRNLQ